MKRHFPSLALFVLVVLSFTLAAIPPAAAAPAAPLAAISLSSAYSQNFNTLATSGTANPWTNDSTISGWYSNQTVYIADAGTNTTGGQHSYGSTSSTERALGSIGSNASGTIYYGVRFVNDTGLNVTSLTVSYTGEQWRNGGNTTQHKLDFAYQVGATVTDVTAGAWTNVDSLDFTGPIATSSAAALDGNASANRVSLSYAFSITLGAGQEVMLRWMDVNDSGNDHALAVDDLAVTATTSPADSAPSVTGTSPADGAPGVAANAAVTVTFSEGVAFAGTVSIVCTSGTQTVTPTGGPQTWTLPHNDFAPGDTCAITIPASQITDLDANDPPDYMAADFTGWDFTIAAGFTKIHAIQGSGSTAASGTFTVEAIVVGDFQGVSGVNDYKLDGFFIQEEDTDADLNPATSEGIFVYCAACATNVVVGDKVQVTGAAEEYFGMSQLNATATGGGVVVVSAGNPLPTPAALTLPVPGVTATDLAGATAQINAYYEPFEGMLVRFGASLSITEYFELYRYGQVVLAQGGRFRQFTDVNAPSAAGYTDHQIDLARRTVILDDDSNQQNHALMEDPDIAVFHPVPGFSITNYFRGGDAITNLTGVLHWSFAGLTGTDAWRVRPVTSAFSYAFTSGNPRPAAPAPAGNVKVASFNVLNYFTTLNSRGADSTAELDRQATKIVAALMGLNADVIGVMEIENNGTAIADLVGRLNAAAGAGAYAYIATGVVGDDAITVGIIYKPARVTPVGAVQVLTDAAFTDPNNTGAQRSRPAVAQTFEEATWGERFTVVVNHLKSKGCSDPAPTGADADQLDGQGCWNDTRAKGAAYLVNAWLPALALSTGDADFLIIGDLNSYRREAPISAITGAGYTDLLNRDLGAAAYGYVFDGQLGYLDHALGSASLSPQVSAAAHWHINADEVNLLDYNDTIKDGTAEQDYEAKPTATELYEPNAYRSSDHDPVLAGLGLYPDLSDLPAGYGLAWHTGQGTPWRLGATWTAEASSGPGTDSDDGVARSPNDSWNDTRGEVYVTVTGPASQWACLNAWLDYGNGDAVIDTPETPNNLFDSNEHVVVNRAMQPSAATQLVTWTLPSGVINSAAQYNMRFRLAPDPNNDGDCSDGAASPIGRANGGEVEDHTFSPGPLAITLGSFTATGQADAVLVAWETLSEIGNAGFYLYRDTAPAGPGARLNASLIPSQGSGSPAGFSYTYLDSAGLAAGTTYYYWLEDVSLGGVATRHAPASVTFGAPTAVTLGDLGAGSASSLVMVVPVLAGLGLASFGLAGLAFVRRRKG